MARAREYTTARAGPLVQPVQQQLGAARSVVSWTRTRGRLAARRQARARAGARARRGHRARRGRANGRLERVSLRVTGAERRENAERRAAARSYAGIPSLYPLLLLLSLDLLSRPSRRSERLGALISTLFSAQRLLPFSSGRCRPSSSSTTHFGRRPGRGAARRASTNGRAKRPTIARAPPPAGAPQWGPRGDRGRKQCTGY